MQELEVLITQLMPAEIDMHVDIWDELEAKRLAGEPVSPIYVVEHPDLAGKYVIYHGNYQPLRYHLDYFERARVVVLRSTADMVEHHRREEWYDDEDTTFEQELAMTMQYARAAQSMGVVTVPDLLRCFDVLPHDIAILNLPLSKAYSQIQEPSE
ncbi:MAG: hypothetical protein ABIG95_04060 [Candidatus Woesearchaeota archaeon]